MIIYDEDECRMWTRWVKELAATTYREKIQSGRHKPYSTKGKLKLYDDCLLFTWMNMEGMIGRRLDQWNAKWEKKEEERLAYEQTDEYKEEQREIRENMAELEKFLEDFKVE